MGDEEYGMSLFFNMVGHHTEQCDGLVDRKLQDLVTSAAQVEFWRWFMKHLSNTGKNSVHIGIGRRRK